MLQSSATAGVSLTELFSAFEHIGHDAVRATSCTNDWRRVQAGDVYVATVNADSDGHDHSQEAVGRGAAAVIAERWLPVFDVPQWIVADSRVAYGEMCHALMDHPSEQVKVIGVSGTCGKTSVVELVGAVLRAAGAQVGSMSGLGVSLDDHTNDAQRETPQASHLAEWLAELDAAACTHAVLEVSSAALCQARLAGMQLDVACLTQIGSHHLDLHGSAENYREAKARLFDHLNPTGMAVLNGDDPGCLSVASRLLHPLLTYGIRQDAEVTAVVVEQFVNEQTFLLTAGTDTAAVRTEIVGTHHIENCLAAATIGLAYGIDLTTIARGLQSVVRLPGRMERIDCGQGFAVFVDDAHGADSLRACLQAARQVAGGSVVCVFGSERTPHDERAAVLRALSRLADAAIVTSGSFRESQEGAESDIATGGGHPPSFKPHDGAGNIEVISDRTEAVARALAMASPQDVVVVAGNGSLRAGYREQECPGLGDREAVLDLLQQSADAMPSERAA